MSSNLARTVNKSGCWHCQLFLDVLIISDRFNQTHLTFIRSLRIGGLKSLKMSEVLCQVDNGRKLTGIRSIYFEISIDSMVFNSTNELNQMNAIPKWFQIFGSHQCSHMNLLSAVNRESRFEIVSVLHTDIRDRESDKKQIVFNTKTACLSTFEWFIGWSIKKFQWLKSVWNF